MSRLTQKQKRVIAEVLRVASMETASFSRIGAPVTELPMDESEVTGFICRRTRLWRESYILAPLRALLEKST
jgi:hypothetical protein